jgi:hypothetical protein
MFVPSLSWRIVGFSQGLAQQRFDKRFTDLLSAVFFSFSGLTVHPDHIPDDTPEPITVPCSVGDALLFGHMMPHRSEENNSDGARNAHRLAHRLIFKLVISPCACPAPVLANRRVTKGKLTQYSILPAAACGRAQ